MEVFPALSTTSNAKTYLPSSLICYAGIKKECTIIGVNDRLEIWATDKFDSLINDNMDAISDVAENLFEGFDNIA